MTLRPRPRFLGSASDAIGSSFERTVQVDRVATLLCRSALPRPWLPDMQPPEPVFWKLVCWEEFDRSGERTVRRTPARNDPPRSRVSNGEEDAPAAMSQAITWTTRGGAAQAVENGRVGDDGDLVARARSGDPVAFERLYEQYHAPILNYLHRMVSDRALAEDLTQDTFEKAYKALPSTRPDLAFKAWLYRIATNTAISNGRRKRIIQWVPFAPGQDPASNVEVEASVTRKHDVEKTLAKLPPHYSAALLLRHYQGLSLIETAEALGITETACKLRLFRARKAFAAAYGGPSTGDPEVRHAMEHNQ